jgi:hypothetical protein
MDSVRYFLDQLLQFHSIERGYLSRHGELLSWTWYQIHNETCDRWALLIDQLRIYDSNYMLPSLELPTEYNQQESLEQLHGFYWIAKGAAVPFIQDPVVGQLAKRVYNRYDAAAQFLTSYIPFIKQNAIAFVNDDSK